MQEMDQRDRELLGALQGEIPLVATPFAFLGQTLEMSEKEVIKRTERLKREGVVRQVAAQFDARALGYRSCLVAARVTPERIDDAAAVVNAHPGVTKNYRRSPGRHRSASSSAVDESVFSSRYFTIIGVARCRPCCSANAPRIGRAPGTTTAPNGISSGRSAVRR
jgi:DNA-binding Lrp family transcriptional regulator